MGVERYSAAVPTARGRSVFRCLLCAWLALLAGTGALAAERQICRLTILHTNDLGGALLPGAYYDESGRGGFARLLGMLRRQQEQGSTLLLDGGDVLGDAPLSRFDRGALAAALMREAGYAAMVPGNHDFDYGIDTLEIRLGEMDFPALVANVTVDGDAKNPFQTWILVERGGVKIGLAGLIAPGVEKVINPRRNPGIHSTEPGEALGKILPELRAGADYVVVLVHMEEERAVELARRFPEVDLFIAGGFRRAPRKGAIPHRIELVNGVRLLTTPGQGAYLGRIDIELEKGPEGVREIGFAARLLPVDEKVESDSRAAARIDDLAAAFSRAGEQLLGRVPGGVERAPQFVVEGLRRALEAEVGVLNQGCLYPVALGETVTQGDVQRLVRFDNLLVAIEVSGKELVDIAARSKGSERYGQRLVFAGYDPGTGEVNGRRLNKEETYVVVTTAFLAEGGDGYFTPRGQRYRTPPGISLRQAVIDHIGRLPEAGAAPKYRVWKTQAKVNGSLALTEIDERAAAYGDVSFLSGRSALAWNSQVDLRTSLETPTGSLLHLLKSGFGQVRTGGGLEEAADRLQTDLIYTRETFTPAPFAALALNTVWTVKEGAERPLTLRGSLGLHRVFNPQAKVRLGLGVERDFAAAEYEWGVEVSPEFQRKFKKNNSFSSTLKLFVGVTEARTVSLQHYNALAIHLRGDLYATLAVNLFAHRSSAVGDLGLKTELQAGLGYTWNDKWF